MANLDIVATFRSKAPLTGTGPKGKTAIILFHAGDSFPVLAFAEDERTITFRAGVYLFSVARSAVDLQVPERRANRPEPPPYEFD